MLVRNLGLARLRLCARMVVATVLLGSVPAAFAVVPPPTGGTPVTGEFNAAEATATSYYQSRHQVAVDALGNSIVVWEDNATSTRDGWIIKGRCFDPSGLPKSNSFQISASSSSAQRFPAVAMSTTGAFMVAWEDFNSSSTDQAHRIVARRFTSACDTSVAGSQFVVQGPNVGTDEIHTPSVAMTSGGDSWIFWNQNFVATGAKYSGVLTMPSATIVETRVGLHYSPVVAVDKAGNVALAFTSESLVGDFDIAAQGFDVNGNAFTDPSSTAAVTVNTTVAGKQDAPTISMNASGKLVIAWESDVTGKEVQAQLFQVGQTVPQTFTPVGTEITAVAASSTHFQAAPSAAIDYAGNFWLAWQDVDADGPGIVTRWYNAGSSSFPSSATRVNATTANAQVLPTIAADTDGDLLTAWLNQGGEGLAADDVLLRKFSGHESVDLSVSGAHAPSVVVGGANLTYTLTVSNLHAVAQNAGVDDTSIGAADGVYLTDTLPSNASYSGFSGAGWTCTQSLQIINCTYAGTLLPGANTSVAISVVPSSGGAIGTTTISNSVSIGANQFDSSTSNNSWSDQQTITLGAPTLAVPTMSGNAAALSWTAVPGASFYRIYRGQSSGTETFIGTTTNATFTTGALFSGTTYYFVVKAFDSSGNYPGPLSNEQTFLRVAPVAPTLSAPVRSGNNAVLNWNSVSGATLYRVYRGTSSGNETFYGSTTSTTLNSNGMVQGTTYYFTVIAYDSGNNASASSNEVSFTLPSPPVMSTPVRSGNNAVLSWTAVQGAALYRIYRGTSSGGETFYASTTNVTSTDTGVAAGTTYYYTVVAYDAGGNSTGPSNEVSFIISLPPVVSAPTRSGNSAVLNWTTVSGATLYRIYRGTSSGGETFLASTTGTNFTATGLTQGTTYYFTVVAYDAAGNGSGPSNEVSFVLPASPVLNAPVRSGSNAALSWTPVPGATLYRIYRGTSSGGETFYASTTATGYTASGMTVGTTYYFTVIAYDSSGYGTGASNEVSFTP